MQVYTVSEAGGFFYTCIVTTYLMLYHKTPQSHHRQNTQPPTLTRQAMKRIERG